MKQRGYYGNFGGAFLPEILISTFDELESHFSNVKQDPQFWKEYQKHLVLSFQNL